MAATTGSDTTSDVKPAFSRYLRGTEGIRGISSLLVVFYHCYLYTSPDGAPSRGWPYQYGISRLQFALSLFFMLSAFLLYLPFVSSILRGKSRPAFGAYLANRALRIFPAYWAILALAAVLGLTVVWIPTHDFAFHLPTFVANAFLVHSFFPNGMQTGVPPSWSLIVEWVFYLLLPLLVLLALRIGGSAPLRARRRAALLAPALLLLVIGLLGREWSRRTQTPEDFAGVLNTWHAVIDKSFPSWADMFAFGMIVAVLRIEVEDGRLRLPPWWRPAAIVGWISLSAFFIWASVNDHIEYHRYETLIGVPGALFLMVVVLYMGDTRRDPLMRVLEWRPFVKVGDISLSLYLLHYPVIVFFIDKGVFISGWGGVAFNTAFVLAVTLTLAYFSHRFIELPAMNRKIRTKAAGPPPPVDLAPAPAPAPEPARA